ncbi:MAG TPA: META domain-containing protein [Candidatus Eisenbacteria bacterium]
MLQSVLEEAGQHRRLIAAWLMTAAIAFTWAGCSQAPHHSNYPDYRSEHMALHTDGKAPTSDSRHANANDQAINTGRMSYDNQQAVAGAYAVGDTDPNRLRGTTWEWIHLSRGSENVSVIDPQNYTVSFDGDGYVHVRSDCNKAAGPSKLGDGSISINLMRMTDMPCNANSLSDRFTAALTRVSAWRVSGDQLMLEIPGESSLLRFKRAG